MDEGWKPLTIGRGEVLLEGDDLLIVAYGAMVAPALETSKLLFKEGISSTVINARFLRPLDQALIHPLARRIGKVVTMEEAATPGGFGASIVESLVDENILVPTLRIGIPDKLVDHASPKQSKEALGLTPEQMNVKIVEYFSLKTVNNLVDTPSSKKLEKNLN